MIYTDISFYRRRLLAGRLSNLKSQHGANNVDPKWLLPNKEGLQNFSIWLETLYMALPDNVKWSQYCLQRRNENLPWTEDNCYLLSLKEQFAIKPRRPIQPEKVEKILSCHKEDPQMTLFKRAAKHEVSIGTVSKIIRFNKAGKFKKGIK